MLKVQAVAAIQEEENKERAKRERAVKLNQEIKEINSHNKQIKERDLQKEREQEVQINEYRKNQGIYLI